MQPPHCHLNLPHAEIGKDYLEVVYQDERLDPTKVRQQLDKLIADIRFHLDQVTEAGLRYNATISDKIRGYIQTRKKRILERRNLVERIGLPIQPRPDAPKTYAIPNVRRKPRVAMPIVKEKGFVPEPALSEQEYESILAIMRNMVRVMERSPNAFRNLEE